MPTAQAHCVLATLLFASGFSLACDGAKQDGDATGAKAASAASGEAKAPETPKPVAMPKPSATMRLLVANDTGLIEVDGDGKELAKLSKGAAMRPRKLADGSTLFLQEANGTLTLQRYRESKGVSEVAKIPTGFTAEGCKLDAKVGGSDSDPLAVQSDHGFTVNEATGHACVTLADRNENMADLSFALRVDLATGKLESRVELDNIHDCPVGKALECGGELPAPVAAKAKGKPSMFAWSWDDKEAKFSPAGKPDDAGATHMCAEGVDAKDTDEREVGCAHEESRSRGGRFVLVSGTMSEGDYIHRELFVLDLAKGEVLGLMGDDAAVKVVKPIDVMTEGFGSLSVVGESDVRWLGEDRLWVDGLLVNAVDRKTKKVGGYLAW